MAVEAAGTPDLSVWAGFGLPGLVIGALFLTVWGMGLFIVMRILIMQSDERKQWRETVEKMTDVIREMKNEFQLLNNRRRSSD